MSADLGALKAAVLEALRAALAELDPTRLVARALPPLPPKRARVRVVAAGKAAGRMAAGALERWGARIEDMLTVTNEGAADPPLGAPHGQAALNHQIPGSSAISSVLYAAHPVPDSRSARAAEEALRRAGELGRDDLLVALISGGASSLLALPPPGVSLAEKQALVAGLLASGAPITDVNLVRRHFSRIKGGRLAAAAASARVLTLILSDVIGGAPHDVGSGPTVPDPTTVADAVAVLRRYMPDRASPAATNALTESLKPGPGLRLRAQILADPEALARAVAEKLDGSGLVRARAIEAEQGDARALVQRRLEQARHLSPGEAVVIPCEPTLALPERRGRGGRAGWVALAAMRDLPDGVLLLCAASDGVDGSSGAGGAAVTRLNASALDVTTIDEALAAFDDASVHEALGTHVEGGPTGHNLTDVHVLARTRP